MFLLLAELETIFLICYYINNMTTQTIKTKNNIFPSQVLQNILKEIRLLRNEMMLLFPQDDLEDYSHSERVKCSYQKAIKKYPSSSLYEDLPEEG